MAGLLSPHIWPANARVDLVNVPWDSAYRDVVRFENRAALDAYIDGLLADGQRTKTITQMSYMRVDQPIRLADPYNNLLQYNYLRVSETSQPVDENGPEEERSFYYFITGIRHVAPNTTEVTVQLDVYQTYIYGTSFGRCFVERGHVGIAQTQDDFGMRYLSVPEGLDLGAELVVRKQELADIVGDGYPSRYDWLIFATADLSSNSEWGTANEPNTPIPSPAVVFGQREQVGVYVVPGDGPRMQDFLNYMRSYPWIAQTILGIYKVPRISAMVSGSYSYGELPSGVSMPPVSNPRNEFAPGITALEPSWRSDMEAEIPSRYRHLRKFLTSPYMSITLSMWGGNSLTLRPESFTTSGMYLGIRFSPYFGSTYLRAYPRNYNYTEGGEIQNDPNRELYVTSGQLASLNLVNDTGALAKAQNAYTRSFQTQNASYTRDIADRQTQRSYDSTSMALESAQQQQRIEADFATSQQAQAAEWNTQDAWRKGITNVGTGAALGILGGGAGVAAGAVGGALQTGLGVWESSIQNDRNAQLTSQQNAQSAALLNNAQSNQYTDRDENAALARYASKGNYEQAIASIQAQVQSTNIIPPSLIAQQQGDVMNDGGLFRPLITISTVSNNVRARIGDFWLRYGYAINEYVTPQGHGHVMAAFTYWKMAECILYGDMPENYKTALRGVFEKGVTQWRNPDDIGFRLYDNAPVTGDYY